MDINPQCYTFKRLETVEGFFDPSVDVTYVITLEGNGRYEHIEKQFKEYYPTRIVYILNNKGYKKCKKNLKENLPRYDLTDAFITVFKHAGAHKYKNILVLEDDFIFSEKVRDDETLAIVNRFVADRTDTDFMYLLGCLPIFQVPYDTHHNIPMQSGGTHAVIYSRPFRERILKAQLSTTIDDWDIYNNTSLNRYTYHEPLVYQLFPMTDNRTNWPCPEMFLYLADKCLTFLQLDTRVEPGYSIFYAISKALFYIAISVTVLAFAFLIYSIGSSNTLTKLMNPIKGRR